MKTTDLANWVVYYCYFSDWPADVMVPWTIHAVEMPNTGTMREDLAKATWVMEYRPANNKLEFIAMERCPQGWHNSDGLPATVYYHRRVCALKGIAFLPDPEPKPDPDDIMKAIRDFCKRN